MKPEKTGNAVVAHSPKLQIAALEIKEIMKKHDIAGIIDLYVPGFNEVVLKIDASFSVCEIDQLNKLKINRPIVDPSTPELERKKAADTINMLANIRLYTGQFARVLLQAEMSVRQVFNIPLVQPPSNGQN